MAVQRRHPEPVQDGVDVSKAPARMISVTRFQACLNAALECAASRRLPSLL